MFVSFKKPQTNKLNQKNTFWSIQKDVYIPFGH